MAETNESTKYIDKIFDEAEKGNVWEVRGFFGVDKGYETRKLASVLLNYAGTIYVLKIAENALGNGNGIDKQNITTLSHLRESIFIGTKSSQIAKRLFYMITVTNGNKDKGIILKEINRIRMENIGKIKELKERFSTRKISY